MNCGPRVAATLLALLLVAAPAVAQDSVHWRTAPTSRLAALNAALVPVDKRLADAKAAYDALTLTSLDTVVTYATEMQDTWLEMQAIAVAGLDVLDAYPPEPCFMDYWAVLRVGFLKLGDSAAQFPVGGGSYAEALALIYSEPLPGYPPAYADLVASVTDCGGT